MKKDSVANLLEHCKEIVDIGCDNNLIIRCLFIYAKKWFVIIKYRQDSTYPRSTSIKAQQLTLVLLKYK